MSETVTTPELVTLDNPEAVVFDMDRTFFDVDRFWGYFLDAAHKITGVDQVALDATHKDEERPAWQPYDALAEVEKLIGRDLSDEDIEEIEQALVPNAHKFLIDGAAETYRAAQETALIFIVTTGVERYQKLKFGLISPLLGNTPPDDFICTDGSKADEISGIIRKRGLDTPKVAYVDDRTAHLRKDDMQSLIAKGLQAVWYDDDETRLEGRMETPPFGCKRTGNLKNIIFYKE